MFLYEAVPLSQTVWLGGRTGKWSLLLSLRFSPRRAACLWLLAVWLSSLSLSLSLSPSLPSSPPPSGSTAGVSSIPSSSLLSFSPVSAHQPKPALLSPARIVFCGGVWGQGPVGVTCCCCMAVSTPATLTSAPQWPQHKALPNLSRDLVAVGGERRAKGSKLSLASAGPRARSTSVRWLLVPSLFLKSRLWFGVYFLCNHSFPMSSKKLWMWTNYFSL